MIRTKNIKLCAYLALHGIHPVEVEKVPGQRGKAEYVFKLTEEDWGRWQIKFNNSDFIKYANHLESIKDLAY
jgi:hypothetical protein